MNFITRFILLLVCVVSVHHLQSIISLQSTMSSGQQDSSCLPPKPPSSLAIKANVTKDLSTCDYWGLRVTGGVPPYTISLAAVGSPVVTNVTLPTGLDVLTYIDRADPNGLLLGRLLVHYLIRFLRLNILTYSCS